MTIKYAGFTLSNIEDLENKTITCEQLERLQSIVHACFSKIDLIKISEVELEEFAYSKIKEWWD